MVKKFFFLSITNSDTKHFSGVQVRVYTSIFPKISSLLFDIEMYWKGIQVQRRVYQSIWSKMSTSALELAIAYLWVFWYQTITFNNKSPSQKPWRVYTSILPKISTLWFDLERTYIGVILAIITSLFSRKLKIFSQHSNEISWSVFSILWVYLHMWGCTSWLADISVVYELIRTKIRLEDQKM